MEWPERSKPEGRRTKLGGPRGRGSYGGDVPYTGLQSEAQGHHLSTKLKTAKTRNRKMAALQAYSPEIAYRGSRWCVLYVKLV